MFPLNPETIAPPKVRHDGRSCCPVCILDPRTHGRAARALFTHHGLAGHLRTGHVDWSAARVERTWPAFFAALKAVCPGCRNVSTARMKSRAGGFAAALALAMKSSPGGVSPGEDLGAFVDAIAGGPA